VNDLSGADLASQRFRKHEHIEAQQQFVVSAKLVGEGEANWNELSWFTLVFGGHAFHRVEF
jgi:hypothetical protein